MYFLLKSSSFNGLSLSFLSLIKNTTQDGVHFRINVRSISKITDLANLPIDSIEINTLNYKNLGQIKELISLPGETKVTLVVNNKSITHHYKLTQKRKINQKIISDLKTVGVAFKIG